MVADYLRKLADAPTRYLPVKINGSNVQRLTNDPDLISSGMAASNALILLN